VLDPDPARIRARYAQRDRAAQDDHVSLLLDPFRDHRRGFEFRVTPLGVQTDAMYTGGEYDLSWDATWRSAGRITPEGYVVEAAIPFRALRFPRTRTPQTWGVIVGRSYPRGTHHQLRSVRTDRDNACLLCQASRMAGLAAVSPGRNVDLAPTLTLNREDAPGTPTGPLRAGDPRSDVGITARWGITSSLSGAATINPDFSHVEADAARLSVNQRFALFFPERRPFFLEGSEVFQSPVPAVFTRTLVDPLGGAKVTGKEGAHTMGVFTAADRVNTLLFPSNQGSAQTLLDEPVTTGVLRYRRDVGQSSSVGVLFTERGSGDYHNRVGGIDGWLQFTGTTSLAFQLLRSGTRYPGALAEEFGQPRQAFSGSNALVRVNHESRHLSGSLGWQHAGAGFRADAGFVPRVDVRGPTAQLEYVLWGNAARDGFDRLSLGGVYERLVNGEGELTDRSLALMASYAGPLQTHATVVGARETRRVGAEVVSVPSFEMLVRSRPSGALGLRLAAVAGRWFDFDNGGSARNWELGPGLDLRLGRHLSAGTSYAVQRMSRDGVRLFAASVAEARLTYDFDTRASVRTVLQHQVTHFNPALYSVPVPERDESLFAQWLFSYRLNPQTVLYAGYSDDRAQDGPRPLVRTGRAFFLKLGYGWRL
jgi:hypothetical protein